MLIFESTELNTGPPYLKHFSDDFWAKYSWQFVLNQSNAVWWMCFPILKIEQTSSIIGYLLLIVDIYLVNQCLKIRLWIPLKIDKNLLLNSTLLQIITSPLVFSCSYASSVIRTVAESADSLRNSLKFADISKFWEFHSNFADSTYSCGKQNN